MKNCSYCGRENTDAATHCIECGTDAFTAAAAQGDEHQTPDTLVRDYPKPIVVVGLWMIYLPAFIANSVMVLACVFGGMGGFPGVLCFIFSGGCASLCGYALYRAVKNYQIHRARLIWERANEARSETAALTS